MLSTGAGVRERRYTKKSLSHDIFNTLSDSFACCYVDLQESPEKAPTPPVTEQVKANIQLPRYDPSKLREKEAEVERATPKLEKNRDSILAPLMHNVMF